VFRQVDACTSGFHVGLRYQLYKGKVEYPESVLLVRDCVRLYEMMTFSILLQLKEFSLQLLRPKLQSTACESPSLDFTLPHSVRRSKVRGKVSHVALQRESYTVAVFWMSSKTCTRCKLLCSVLRVSVVRILADPKVSTLLENIRTDSGTQSTFCIMCVKSFNLCE